MQICSSIFRSTTTPARSLEAYFKSVQSKTREGLLLEITSPWAEARPVVMANKQLEAAQVWTTLRTMLSLHQDKKIAAVSL